MRSAATLRRHLESLRADERYETHRLDRALDMAEDAKRALHKIVAVRALFQKELDEAESAMPGCVVIEDGSVAP